MQDKPTSTSVISPAHAALGSVVRELRARRHISQEELGFRSKLHRNYVGAIERGEINPTFRTMLTLATGLDIRLSSVIRLAELRSLDAARSDAAGLGSRSTSPGATSATQVVMPVN